MLRHFGELCVVCYLMEGPWVLAVHLPSEAVGRDHQVRPPPTRTPTTTTAQAKTMETVVAMTMVMDKHLLARTPIKTRTMRPPT